MHRARLLIRSDVYKIAREVASGFSQDRRDLIKPWIVPRALKKIEHEVSMHEEEAHSETSTSQGTAWIGPSTSGIDSK